MINKKHILKIALISLLCFDTSLAEDESFENEKPISYVIKAVYDRSMLGNPMMGLQGVKFSGHGGGIGLMYNVGKGLLVELEGKYGYNGHTDHLSGFFNAYYFTGFDTEISNYFGVGIGASRLSQTDKTTNESYLFKLKYGISMNWLKDYYFVPHINVGLGVDNLNYKKFENLLLEIQTGLMAPF